MSEIKRILGKLLPVKPGQVIRQPYPYDRGAAPRYLGLRLRRFTEIERAQLRGARGFVNYNSREATASIELDSGGLPGMCPVAAYLIGLHESAHVSEHLSTRATAGRATLAGSAEVEAEAWRFTAEAAQKHLSLEAVEHCLGSECVGASEAPTSCTQPNLGAVFMELGGPVAAPEAVGLGGALLKAVRRSPAWFGKAAKGLTGSDGKPLTGKRKAEARRPRKRQQIRIKDYCSGGFCGPQEPKRIVAWVTTDGRVLDPAKRLWSAAE